MAAVKNNADTISFRFIILFLLVYPRSIGLVRKDDARL